MFIYFLENDYIIGIWVYGYPLEILDLPLRPILPKKDEKHPFTTANRTSSYFHELCEIVKTKITNVPFVSFFPELGHIQTILVAG